MKRQPFTEYILEKNILEREKYYLKSKHGNNAIETIIHDALLISQENFRSGVKAKRFQLNGKAVYSTNCIKEKIILRHCANNLNQAIGLNIKQRNSIIDEVKTYLREGSQYRVYRLDIKSFFESIDQETLLNKIEKNINISRHTRNLVEWYIKGCNLKNNNKGLPRGLEISPVLSEIYFIDFDETIKKHQNVLYYARFVDDIIIITTGNENSNRLLNTVRENLPQGLKFNSDKYKKSISPIIEPRKQAVNDPDGDLLFSFNFLGYQIKIINTKIQKGEGKPKAAFRLIKVDFSNKRLKKFKTRISRSFYSYNKNKDFKLLCDRIKFLTSNRELKRYVKGQNHFIKNKISTGIFYSNSKLDPNSAHLEELDKFLYFCIKNKSSRLQKNGIGFSKDEEKEILKNSFRKGFIKKTHISFNYKRYEEIKKIWQ